MHFMLQILHIIIMQGQQQRTVAQILSVIQTQWCIFHSQLDFLNLLVIRMLACLAHLKPSMAVMHLCALCTLALWSALHKDVPCFFTTLTLTAQRRASVQRCSSLLSPLFSTFIASHRCAPPLPPIRGRPDESAARLAPEARHTVRYG